MWGPQNGAGDAAAAVGEFPVTPSFGLDVSVGASIQARSRAKLWAWARTRLSYWRGLWHCRRRPGRRWQTHSSTASTAPWMRTPSRRGGMRSPAGFRSLTQAQCQPSPGTRFDVSFVAAHAPDAKQTAFIRPPCGMPRKPSHGTPSAVCARQTGSWMSWIAESNSSPPLRAVSSRSIPACAGRGSADSLTTSCSGRTKRGPNFSP